MDDSRVVFTLPPSMFMNELGPTDNFIAYIIKSPRSCDNLPSSIFQIDPVNKKITQVLLNEDISNKISTLVSEEIEGTPYIVFHLEGDEEWSINLQGFRSSKTLNYKGTCYITGNIIKDEKGWNVIPVKFSQKDIEDWIRF